MFKLQKLDHIFWFFMSEKIIAMAFARLREAVKVWSSLGRYCCPTHGRLASLRLGAGS